MDIQAIFTLVLFCVLALVSTNQFHHALRMEEISMNSEIFKSSDRNPIIEGNYESPLDHFSPTDDRRLHQKYEVNTEFFKRGGPMFFYVYYPGGLGDSILIQRGLVCDVARELNGAVILWRLRYLDYDRISNFTDEALKQMTIDHIVADFPYLANKVKIDLNSPTSRIVTFGQVYGGTIAVLAAKMFPHVVDGAWCSSGIFRAVATDSDFYRVIAKQLLAHGNEKCTNALSMAFRELEEIVGAKNVTKLRTLFRIVDPIDLSDQQDVQFFYQQVFSEVPTYLYDLKWRNIPDAFRNFCADMSRTENALESFMTWYLNQFGDEEDISPTLSYKKTKEIYFNIPIFRVIEYLHCTQFGSKRYVTTADTYHGKVFPNVITERFYDRWCTDLFENTYNRTLLERAILNFNLQHGGGTQIVDNVIFSDGNLNPYRSNGVTEYDTKTSQFVNTEFCARTADIFEVEVTDTTELVAAKNTIIAALKRFAGQEY